MVNDEAPLTEQPSQEIPISSEEAERLYGIHCCHSKMPTNGEFRFRHLSNSDGTAYIRTQTADDGGWQNSHYHKGVKETYIIQQGWICYAEIRDGRQRYVKYEAGQLVTTEPFIAHNIYMPPHVIIHTVKHGDSVSNPNKNKNDWWDDSTDTKELQGATMKTKRTEAEILNLVRSTKLADLATAQPYNEAYRHFDNLIWAIPGVAAAIIAGVFAAFSNVISALSVKGKNGVAGLNEIIGLSQNTMLILVLIGTALLLLLLSYAVHRYRWHQGFYKTPPTKHRWINPQVLLLLFINCVAFAFLWVAARVALLINGAPLSMVPEYFNYVLPILIAAGITWWQNFIILRDTAGSRPALGTAAFAGLNDDTLTRGSGAS